MDGWLKGLVAAACVVVIAAGGYYLGQQIVAWRSQRQASEATSKARQEIFKLANADANDLARVRAYCKELNARLETDLKGTDMAEIVARNCRLFGYS